MKMKERTLKKILLALGMAFIVIFFLTPFIWMAVISTSGSPDLPARGDYGFSLRSYIDIIVEKDLQFMSFLRNSLLISALSALSAVLIGASAAYAVSRLEFRGKTFLILSALAMSMFPQISIVGYLYKFMSGLGWLNTYQALILPYVALSLPLALWIMLSYFSQIPTEIDRAALVDGATRAQVLFRVIMPVSLPVLFSSFLLLFMFNFNEFLFALMLTTDDRARTVPVGIALFQGLHGEIPWGHIMAASVISSIPVIAITLLFQRYIIQGLTRGAVKE